jgi:hypothetical protein
VTEKVGFGGSDVSGVSALKAAALMFVEPKGRPSGSGVGGLSGRASGLASSSGRLKLFCQQTPHENK